MPWSKQKFVAFYEEQTAEAARLQLRQQLVPCLHGVKRIKLRVNVKVDVEVEDSDVFTPEELRAWLQQQKGQPQESEIEPIYDDDYEDAPDAQPRASPEFPGSGSRGSNDAPAPVGLLMSTIPVVPVIDLLEEESHSEGLPATKENSQPGPDDRLPIGTPPRTPPRPPSSSLRPEYWQLSTTATQLLLEMASAPPESQLWESS